jgi:signal transduction histidine kinase/DNA-binding response OmpR family regulator
MTIEQALATTPTVSAIARPSILLVDDRPENLAALEAILEDLDVRLVRANSGVEALRHLLNEDFALILLDVQMPELDGYETARLVRERTKTAHVPIIFLSAIDRDEHHALRGYGLGAVDFLPKPLNPYVLKAKASVFVELYAMRERLAQQAEALQASEARRIRRVRHALLRADVSEALSHEGTTRELLQRCASAMVAHFDAALALIWTLDQPTNMLALQANAGPIGHLDDRHTRVPVGQFKIGLIASEREPHLTNDVLNDPRIIDAAWVQREGLVAFAGYPLLVEGQVVGVLAMYSRQALEPDTLEALAAVADAIGQGIGRKEAVQALADRMTELAMMNEELQAQQAELEHLNQQLADHNDRVEAEVCERTFELRAANEELAAQSEELAAQSEELESQYAELETASEQLQAQTQALEAQRRFLESIIQHVPAAVAYLDRDLVFRITNRVYDGILQLPGDQLLNRHVFDALPGAEAQVGPLLASVLETGRPYHASDFVFVLEKDGQPVTTYWDFIYHPMITDPAGGIDGILVLAHDTSRRVEQEQQREQLRVQQETEQRHQARIEALVQADQAKDQFLGILSHELRTPLNAIQGFGSVLEDGLMGELEPDQARYVGKILDASDSMLALVNDLLDMSRVQAGKFMLDRTDIALSPLVQKALASVAGAASDKHQTLVDATAGDLPTLNADPMRLMQVLTNLVTNAIKFTPEGGRITVRTQLAGSAVRFEVEDNGVGIPASEHGRIFLAFTQVDMSDTRQKGGVGLGLSIVKALVEAHGGELGLESEEGRGSTFWFTLPMV